MDTKTFPVLRSRTISRLGGVASASSASLTDLESSGSASCALRPYLGRDMV